MLKLSIEQCNKYCVEKSIKISVEVYKFSYWHLPCFLSLSLIYYSGEYFDFSLIFDKNLGEHHAANVNKC